MGNYDRVIVWRVTQNCDMNCLFCSYSNEVKRLRSDADATEIERLAQVLGDYSKKYNKKILVSWIGGEPLLRKDIFRLSQKMKKFGIDISITTNGNLLDRERRREVLRLFSEIVFSVDGFKKCHDRVRNQNGLFERVCANISALNKEKAEFFSAVKIKVNTILMRENIGCFREFCRYLRSIGVDEITYNQLGGYDRPEFYKDNRLLPNQIKNFMKQLSVIRKELDSVAILGGEKYIERFIASAENRTIPVAECNPGSWFWFINENGFISPCSYTSYEYKFPVSYIQNMGDIENAERYFSDLRKTNRSKWCEDCHCTQIYDKFAQEETIRVN